MFFFSVHVILPALQPPPTKTNQPQVRQRRSGVDVAPYDISELCWAGGVRDPNKNTEKNEEGMASCHFLLIWCFFFLCSWFSWEKYRKHDFESEELNFVGTSCISSEKMN